LTVFSGYLLGSGADYALTKADNQVMKARMALMAAEIARSRDDMDKARQADTQLRALLGMPGRKAIIEGGGSGVGGPAPTDETRLMNDFLKAPTRGAPSALHAEAEALRRESRERVASFNEISKHIEAKRSLYRATPMGWPAQGHRSSSFGYRLSPFSSDDDSEAREFHPGQDIAGEAGSPIRATADGVVARAGFERGYGLMVMIRHQWGYETLFGHCSRLIAKPGQKVLRGEVVALMGSTGRSTGPHVHYEVWRGGRRVNPAPFLATQN
jgi:murein DD-endopeptidase MepM/ murein hydrolase activator NlpD